MRSTTVREVATVTVTTPVDGTRRRTPAAPAQPASPVAQATVPHAAVTAALALAGQDLQRIRPTAAPEAVGGVALIVFNSRAQAARFHQV